MKTFLKLKIRSLNAEATLGYKEAQRWPGNHPLREQIVNHANELLWYLALVTGDRARAERAAAATPGHNFPYHAIQRLLKK